MAGQSDEDRRSNLALRELLDELITHVRDLARRGRRLPAADLEHAQERLEWLADEIWRAALRGDDPGQAPPPA